MYRLFSTKIDRKIEIKKQVDSMVKNMNKFYTVEEQALIIRSLQIEQRKALEGKMLRHKKTYEKSLSDVDTFTELINFKDQDHE